jgi:hypothetical protein
VSNQTQPGTNLVAITPGVEITPPVRAIWIGGAGDVAVVASGDATAQVLKGVAAGQLIPVEVRRVEASGTTASDIVGIR